MPERCFVIAPIGEEGDEIRQRSDAILERVIRPAVEALGYQAMRADELAAPGIITRQVLEQVVKAPLVVADLTGKNGNVFYELAIRHATGAPTVHLIAKGRSIPFDVRSSRAVAVDHETDAGIKSAIEKIKQQIGFLQDHEGRVDNPIELDEEDLADVLEGIARVALPTRQFMEQAIKLINKVRRSDSEKKRNKHLDDLECAFTTARRLYR